MIGVARIALKYAQIACVSTAVNVGCQATVIALYSGLWAVPISVLVGTAAGLPVKYLLEKRHVFGFRTAGVQQDARLFTIYTFFGVFTTGVFWLTEYLFHEAFGTDAMRYLGAALGLAVGYVLRYQLDKRFVFVNAPRGEAA
jgi:putative flippase GtrA